MKLIAQLDNACQSCFWKRRFVKLWEDFGLQGAWDRWKLEAEIVNPEFLPLIESTVQELKRWPFVS